MVSTLPHDKTFQPNSILTAQWKALENAIADEELWFEPWKDGKPFILSALVYSDLLLSVF